MDNGGGEAEKKLDHDEPIVIDNGPVRFEFKKKLTKVNGKEWKRDFTKFNHLLIETETQAGTRDIASHPLLPNEKINIDLDTATFSDPEQVTFSRSGDKLTMKVRDTDFELEGSSNSKLKPSKDLRITALRGNKGKLLLTFVEPNGSGGQVYLYKSVKVLLKAEPHD